MNFLQSLLRLHKSFISGRDGELQFGLTYVGKNAIHIEESDEAEAEGAAPVQGTCAFLIKCKKMEKGTSI